jgi:transposase
MKGSAKLKAEVNDLRRQLKDARQEISILRQKIDALAKRLFGRKTEQLDPGQLELILGQIEREQADPEPEEDEEE